MYNKCFIVSRQFVKSVVFNRSVLKHGEQMSKRWAGHAKWQNIKSTKESNDQQRSEVFQRITRMIPLAVKEGGPDININFKLKRILEESKKVNMPKATFDKAVQNSLKQTAERPYWIVFRGPKGVVLGLEVTFTKNNPMYLQSVLGSFTKKIGFKLEPSYEELCTERGVIIADPLPDVPDAYEKAVEDAIETGVDEVFQNDDKSLLFECMPDRVDSISLKLSQKGYNIQSAMVELDFQNFVKLSDEQIKEMEYTLGKIQAKYQEVLRMSYNQAT